MKNMAHILPPHANPRRFLALFLAVLSATLLSCNDDSGSKEEPQPQDVNKCSGVERVCTADGLGYRVCAAGEWSAVVKCEGTMTCKDGECSGDDIQTKLPCENVNQTKCVSQKRVQVCGKDNYWYFMDCPKDVPICVDNECSVPQCDREGTVKCGGEEALATCLGGKWEYEDCPTDRPICIGDRCVECEEEGETKCTDDGKLATCRNHVWYYQKCEGETPFCNSATGKCVACKKNGDARCSDANHYDICTNHEWVTASCPQNKPVCTGDGTCERKTECVDKAKQCSSDGKGFQVCVSGMWSQTIECLGTATCQGGSCQGESQDDKLPCLNKGEKKCISTSRIEYCDDDGYWKFMNCPAEVPACVADECVYPQCEEGTAAQCGDDTTRATCKNSQWHYEVCPKDKPVCEGGECKAAPAECTAPAQECVTSNTIKTCTDTGRWKTDSCGNGMLCKNNKCAECIDGEAECRDDYHTLRKCVDGRWTEVDCATTENYYCPWWGDKCVHIESGTDCSAPFSLCHGDDLYFCAYGNVSVEGTMNVVLNPEYDKVVKVSCSEECVQTRDGIGANCKQNNDCSGFEGSYIKSNHDLFALSIYDYLSIIRNEGLTGLMNRYKTLIYQIGTSYYGVDCSVCKKMTDDSSMLVPVDSEYCE